MIRIVLAGRNIPAAMDAVRDDAGRIWHKGDDGRWHTLDNRHHLSPAELSARADLVETRKPAESAQSDGSDGKTAELG